MTGTVKTWISTYGFLLGEDRKSYFCHYSNIMGGGYRELKPGERVIFEPVESERGLAAKAVEVVGEGPCA